MIEFIDLKAQQDRIREKIDAGIKRVLDHGQYILGPEVAELEEKLANFVGAKYCVSVANGTDALQVSQMALGVGAGDEVITPGFTYIATAETVALLGAKPVYVDIDPKTYNLDPTKLEAAITSRTKAIIPVSLYGQCADFDAINAIAAKYGIRQIARHGQDRRYHHVRVGVNSRLDTLQAAILIPKLEILKEEMYLRNEAAEKYSQLLSALPQVVTAPFVEQDNLSAWAQYTICVENRAHVQEELRKKGVPSAVHYPIPLNKQPSVADHNVKLEVGDRLAEKVLSLPMHPYIQSNEQTIIVEALRRILVC